MNLNTTTEMPDQDLGVSLVTEKLIVTLGMFATTFVFGMIPLKLFSTVRDNNNVTARIRWQLIISFSSCFAGGVFIAACLLDLLPDVEEKINQVLQEIKEQYKVDVDYPWAQLIMAIGFFIILLLEQTVLHFKEKWMSDHERRPLLSYSRHASRSHNHSHSHDPDDNEDDGHGGNHHHDYRSLLREDSLTGLSNQIHHEDDGHDNHSHISHGVFQHSSLRSFMLLLALSFHSIFEGLAIGLQEESSSLISIFIAVILHKAVMAFSLGLNIAQSNMSVKSLILSNLAFSLASPLGLIIGIFVADQPSSLPQNIANGVLQGIAAGTFLYITFFEVLPHELNVPSKRLWKVLFVMLGFAAICGLLFIAH